MSTTLLTRAFPGLGEPMEFPRIVESIAEQQTPAPKRLLHLGADTGRGIDLDREPRSGVDLDALIPVPEPGSEIVKPLTELAIAESDDADTGIAVETSVSTESDTAVGLEPTTLVKEVKRFSLIDPNQRWVMFVAIGLLGSILAASLVSSFTSVYAASAWVGLPAQVQWLPVVILDVAIVGFSWALMVFASRLADPDLTLDRKKIVRERTWSTRLWLSLVTLYSVAANFLHTYDHWSGDIASPQAVMGAVFSASIPLMALVATEELIRLVFIRRRNVNKEATV